MKFLDKLKEKIYESQDKKIIKKIKEASTMQKLNFLIWCYIGSYVRETFEGPIHYDKTLLEIFKLLDDNHMFDKFKYGDPEHKYRGEWAENPTIFLMNLKEDKNKLDLFNYLRSTIPSNMLNTILIVFASSSSIVDDFLNSIKDKNMKREILNIVYEERNIKTKTLIEIMQDMTSEERKSFIEKHNLSNRGIVSLYNAFDDEFFLQDYYESIKNYFIDKPEEICISRGNKAKEILNLFASEMNSSDICTCINICENELISQGDKYDKRLVEKYSDYIVNMDTLVELVVQDNKENIGWLVKHYANKIDEFYLRYGFVMYNISMSDKDDSGSGKKNNENPHYLYNLAKIYYETRMKDKDFEPLYIYYIAAKLPILDRLRFVQEYSEFMVSEYELPLLNLGEDIVRDKANLNIIETLTKYRNIIPEEDIVYIIEQMPEQERVSLINNCVLSKESIDKIIDYTVKEKGDCTALEKMKFLGDLKFAIAEGRKNANEGISDLDKDTIENRIHYSDGVNR